MKFGGGRYEFRVLETVQSTCLCVCIIIYLIESVLGCWGMCEQVGTTQGRHLGGFLSGNVFMCGDTEILFGGNVHYLRVCG